MTTDMRTTGAISDLTVATEFLMVAARRIAAGHKVKGDEVQTYIGMALRKLDPLVN